MTTSKREIRYTDFVASQDPEEPSERVGVLIHHNTSETVTWMVNGQERFTLTWPELSALIEAATAKPEGAR